MLDFYHHFQNIAPLINFIKSGSYFGVFFFSIIVSYFLPVPEAVFLLLVGYVAKVTGMNLAWVLMYSVIGIIIGDNILYRLSFFGNKYVEKFNHKVRKHKLIRYEHLVIDNVAFSVYFLKFVAGVRFFGPVILGSLRASWKNFFVHNVIASILHTWIFVLIGYYSSRKIIPVMAGVEVFKNLMLLFSAVIIGFLIGFSKEKSTSKKEK